MDLNDLVQECSENTGRWFPKCKDDVPFLALAMGGEAGEVQNLVKKVYRGTYTLEDIKDDLAEECVDVLIYLACLFAALDVDPVEIYKRKQAYNEERFGNGN